MLRCTAPSKANLAMPLRVNLELRFSLVYGTSRHQDATPQYRLSPRAGYADCTQCDSEVE